jgi:AI-2 transport protein TqsA
MSESPEALTDQRVRTACMVILTVVAVGAALAPLRPVLVPLLLAVLFTYCLKPLIGWQVRHLGLPRGVAVGGAILVAVALLAAMGLVVVTFVAELRANLPAYQARFQQLSRELARAVPLEKLGVPIDPEGTFTIPAEATRWLLAGVASSAADLASGGGLVFIFVLFLLLGGPARRPRPGSLLDEIEERAQRYILQMVFISAVTGVLVGLALAVLGVDFAFAFGFIAFLLNFIPTVGPLVATLLPLPVVLLDANLSPTAKVLALLLPTIVQLIFAVIQPRVQGTGQNLHPVTTMAALVFFGSIWGILGAALAVPLTGVIRIILERIPTTRPVAGWMAGDFDVPPAPCPPPPLE